MWIALFSSSDLKEKQYQVGILDRTVETAFHGIIYKLK